MIVVRLCAASVLLLALVAPGCDFGPPRFDIQGEVTYQGKPLPAGVIIFDPDVAKGGGGPQGYAHVKQGKFDTRDAGRKVTTGPHEVRIQGFDGVPGPELPLGRPLFTQQIIKAELDPSRKTIDFTVPDQPRAPQ